jgi:hypothetical protein
VEQQQQQQLKVQQLLLLLQLGMYLKDLMTLRSCLRAGLSAATSGVLCRWADGQPIHCHHADMTCYITACAFEHCSLRDWWKGESYQHDITNMLVPQQLQSHLEA